MGSLFSLPKNQRILIGELSSLPEKEQNLYNLSKFVLDQQDPCIGQVCTKLGIPVVILDTNSSVKPENQTHVLEMEEPTGNDSECKDVSLNGINIQDNNALFYLLVTSKPYYFSQTFSQWRTFYQYSMIWPLPCCRTEFRTIYIQPVDSFPSFITDFEEHMKSYDCSFDFFAILKTFIEIFFDGIPVSLLPSINLMDSKWNIKSRLHKKTGQKQYFVRDFHNRLQSAKPRDGLCIMGISWTDLYPTEELNFVLGEANFATKTGVFCFGRYEPKSFNPETHKDITELDGNILWRILKVISHETCHLFGLQHCWYFGCAMNESNSMKEAAEQPLFLCPVCLRKLQYACQFDVLRRYRKMLRFLTDISEIFPTKEFTHSVLWLRKCIEFLEMES